MKRFSRKALLSIVLFSVSCALFAQVSSTVSSIGIDAKVIAPITIENTGNTALNFGTISRSSTAGTVIVPISGDRTSTGGVGVLGSSSFSRAAFNVTGENNASFNITLPTNGTVQLTRTGGSEKMAVDNFLSSAGTTASLSATGTASFVVGATMTVGADQPAGEYKGSFVITVAYQ